MKKRYGVYGVCFKMWRGYINFSQKPEFSSDSLEDAISYIKEIFKNKNEYMYDDDGLIIVDYFKESVICEYKKDDF